MLATSCDRTRSWHSERRNHQSSLDPMLSNSASRINRLIRLHSTLMVFINTKSCNASEPINMWNPYISNGNPSPYYKLNRFTKYVAVQHLTEKRKFPVHTFPINEKNSYLQHITKTANWVKECWTYRNK